MVLPGVPAVTAPVLRVRGLYPVEPGGRPVAPSVSTVAGMLSMGDALAWGAAKETALFAVHHRDEWQHLDPTDAYHRLRKHHRGVWTDKASRGTTVHMLAEGWAAGQEVECPPECAVYLDALERWYIDHQPVWMHTERSVIYNVEGREYGGTFDGIAVLKDGRRTLIDWKTGKRYPVEVILKMAAYRYASLLAVVDEIGQFIDTEPMPEVDECAAVYLHDDGTYEHLTLPVDHQAHATFLRLRDVWAWKQEAERWLRRTPEPTRGSAA
jgi:hypothetical protein